MKSVGIFHALLSSERLGSRVECNFGGQRNFRSTMIFLDIMFFEILLMHAIINGVLRGYTLIGALIENSKLIFQTPFFHMGVI